MTQEEKIEKKLTEEMLTLSRKAVLEIEIYKRRSDILEALRELQINTLAEITKKHDKEIKELRGEIRKLVADQNEKRCQISDAVNYTVEVERKKHDQEIKELKEKLSKAEGDVWHYENECQIIGDDETMEKLEKRRLKEANP